MKQGQGKWGLWRRRECRCLTWRGWLVLLLAAGGLAALLVWNLYPFLAVNDPVPGGILVVEGWAPDYALQQTVTEYHRNHYSRLFVTGGPVASGGPLSEYQNYAQLGAAVLLHLGLTTNDVQAVPAPAVAQDRTYVSALALKNWLRDHGVGETDVNVLTLGAHARRTRLMFEAALGKNYRVGIVAMPYEGFDPAQWWKSSEGFRTVTGEAIGYCYARFLFRAPS
jgi:hypothetical protein